MNPLIMIKDLEEYSKGQSNFQRNFCEYIQQLLLDNYQHKQNSKSLNTEQQLKNLLKKTQPNGNDEPDFLITIDELVPFFVEECLQNFLNINSCFAHYYLHILIRDSRDGLELNASSKGLNICKIVQFLERALAKYRNPLDATVCSMKMLYFCRNSKKLCLNFVKEKYELDFSERLKQLISNVLQYPESSSNQQLEEMFIKIQVFIITNYHLGCPKNHVLLKKCRQSINSVLGKGDIKKYVLRKRCHRLEYLQKLAATVAGIMIFNNQGPEGDKENMRNIFDDLKMAKCNTKESLEEGIVSAVSNKQRGTTVVNKLIEINIQQKFVYCLRPLIQISEVNKFVVFFEIYKKNLEKVKAAFEKTLYLIEVAQKKFECVVEKINEILKYRSAIESKLIFPHFVYLSEIWSSLALYLNQLAEINKIKDRFDELTIDKFETKFNGLLKELSDNGLNLKNPLKYTFKELMEVKRESELNMLNIKPFVKDYCALTMILTGGFLTDSQLQKKLSENVDISFGFANMDYVKFAEFYFKDFVQVFRNVVLTNSDLILLFQLDDEVIQQDLNLIEQSKAKTKTLDTQTENVLYSEFWPKQRINQSWNVWDFHRQTMNLANIRQRQTRSTQSNLCYGTRNTQNQCDKKLHDGTQK